MGRWEMSGGGGLKARGGSVGVRGERREAKGTRQKGNE